MSVRNDPDASQGADLPGALALRVQQEKQIGRHQRFVERMTKALGRPQTIYLTLLVVAAWIVVNLLAPTLALPVLDPFTRLQGVIGLAALVMTKWF